MFIFLNIKKKKKKKGRKKKELKRVEQIPVYSYIYASTKSAKN